MDTLDLAIGKVPAPRLLWSTFFDACGAQAMYDAYGWETPPPECRSLEHVFAFIIPDYSKWTSSWVGWTSVTEYAKDPGCYELAIGIWPEHRGKGLRRRMLDMTASETVADPAAVQITMLVLDSATAHSVMCLREAERGGAWVYAGRTWYPEPLRAFTLTRESWESSRS
jgi:GNAT superfamily N-acetyltransferase